MMQWTTAAVCLFQTINLSVWAENSCPSSIIKLKQYAEIIEEQAQVIAECRNAVEALNRHLTWQRAEASTIKADVLLPNMNTSQGGLNDLFSRNRKPHQEWLSLGLFLQVNVTHRDKHGCFTWADLCLSARFDQRHCSCFSSNCFPSCVDLVRYSGQEWRWSCQVQPDCPESWKWVSCLQPSTVGFSSLSDQFSSNSLHHSHIILFCLCILELHCECWHYLPNYVFPNCVMWKGSWYPLKIVCPTISAGTTQQQGCSQFPLVELGTTTSPPICCWMKGIGLYLSSGSMVTESAGLMGTMTTVCLSMPRLPAVDSLCWKKVRRSIITSRNCQSICGGWQPHERNQPRSFVWKISPKKQKMFLLTVTVVIDWILVLENKAEKNRFFCLPSGDEAGVIYRSGRDYTPLAATPRSAGFSGLRLWTESTKTQNGEHLEDIFVRVKAPFQRNISDQNTVSMCDQSYLTESESRPKAWSDKLCTITGIWDQKGFTEFIVCEIWNFAISTWSCSTDSAACLWSVWVSFFCNVGKRNGAQMFFVFWDFHCVYLVQKKKEQNCSQHQHISVWKIEFACLLCDTF